MSAQLELAIAERDRGVAKVKAKNSDFVETMRGVARMLARRAPDRTVTADDLRAWLAENPYVEGPTHYNAFGAIFMLHEQPLFRLILIAAFIAMAISVTLLARAYFEASAELIRTQREREAVIDVERFIARAYPQLSAATRRGHAEILIDASCGEIVYNAVACLDGRIADPPPEVRMYAQQVVERHGL